ncbi:hypothetical protein PFISCL1PPCAC_2917, partial [Pristionchus fissidentatus]
DEKASTLVERTCDTAYDEIASRDRGLYKVKFLPRFYKRLEKFAKESDISELRLYNMYIDNDVIHEVVRIFSNKFHHLLIKNGILF